MRKSLKSKARKVKFFLLLTFSFLLLTCQSWATNRYIDTTIAGCAGTYVPVSGGGSCGGGSATSYQTWAAAWTAAGAGDTIYLVTNITLNTGNPRFSITKSGTSVAPIVVTSYGTQKKLTTTTSGGGALLKAIGRSYVTVDNIELDGSDQSLYGFLLDGCSNITITRNKIHDIVQEALNPALNSNLNITIGGLGLGNEIYNTGGTFGECIYFGINTPANSTQITSGYIGYNDIHNCTYEGIEIKPSAQNVIVEHNTIHDIVLTNTGSSNAEAALAVNDLSSIISDRDPKTTIRYNTVYNITRVVGGTDGPRGILSGRRADIYGNIVYNVGSDGYKLRDGTVSGGSPSIDATHKLLVAHNLAYNVNTQSIAGSLGFNFPVTAQVATSEVVFKDNVGPSFTAGYNDSDDYDSDGTPGWTDAPNGDFTLVGGSSLAAAGVAILAGDFANSSNSYSFDIAGVADDLSIGPYSANIAPPATGSLTLNYPNGGERFRMGQTITFDWTVSADWDNSNVDIWVSHNNGSSWYPVIRNTAPDGSGTKTWTIGGTAAAPSSVWRFRVTASSSAATDDSDAVSRVHGIYFK